MPEIEPRQGSDANVLSTLLVNSLPKAGGRRFARFAGEGVLFAAAGIFLARSLGVPQSGFFAIFLASAGLTGRLDALLEENRSGIYGGIENPWALNARTALGVLAMFTGVFAVFAVAAGPLGEGRLNDEFGFALTAAGIGEDTILTRRFASAAGLLAHNFLVLAAILALAFVYRGYGALLALCWNACIWGVVLVLLVRRGLQAHEGPDVARAVLLFASLLPHLILEASAYVLGALGGIFASNGLTKYAPGDPRLLRVLRASATLAVISAGTLLLAALVESSLPPAVVAAFQQ